MELDVVRIKTKRVNLTYGLKEGAEFARELWLYSTH